jgi:hypothetical protein
MISSVAAARPTLRADPNSGVLAGPRAQRTATGSRDTPITVITTPVTTGGKNRTRRVKNGARTKGTAPATISEPKMARSPPARPPGGADGQHGGDGGERGALHDGQARPSRHSPRVCGSVARPEMNSPALSR